MLMPPPHVVRAERLPDDATVVIRGGERSLDDAIIERSVADCWTDYGFFGLSVFADPSTSDIGEIARRTPLIRRRLVRTAQVGLLRAAGFEVVPTFANRYHFSVVLAEATEEVFDALRSCFGPAEPNPAYQR
jgi:hypothetical protein